MKRNIKKSTIQKNDCYLTYKLIYSNSFDSNPRAYIICISSYFLLMPAPAVDSNPAGQSPNLT